MSIIFALGLHFDFCSMAMSGDELTPSTASFGGEDNTSICDTSSELGMPQHCEPSKRIITLANHLPEAETGTEPKRQCRRAGKDIRYKQKVQQVSDHIQKLLRDKMFEKRWGCTLSKAMEKGVAYQRMEDKNGRAYVAVLYSGSTVEKEGIKSITDDKDVYPLIRHGGPWSQEAGLLEKKDFAYLQGNQRFLCEDWKYNAEEPNLTLVWIIYAEEDGQVVGRGGLQPEDSEPPMTEPFIALKKSIQINGRETNVWGNGLATRFFRSFIIPFYIKETNKAPMRILSLPQNTASQKIANNTELPHCKFVQKGSVQEWGQEYNIYELVYDHTSPMETVLEMD